MCLALVVLAAVVDVRTENEAPRRQSLLGRRTGVRNFGKPTPSTTTVAPEEEEYEQNENDYQQENDADVEEDYGNEEEAVISSSTSTTESTKRIGPVIRPFRSNDDLLNALRKRRLEQQNKSFKKPLASKPVIDDVDNSVEKEEKVVNDAPVVTRPAAIQSERGGH